MKYLQSTVFSIITLQLFATCYALADICDPANPKDCIYPPGGSTFQTYNSGQDNACLPGVEVPANVFDNPNYFPNKGADFEIYVITGITVTVEGLGFLPMVVHIRMSELVTEDVDSKDNGTILRTTPVFTSSELLVTSILLASMVRHNQHPLPIQSFSPHSGMLIVRAPNLAVSSAVI